MLACDRNSSHQKKIKRPPPLGKGVAEFLKIGYMEYGEISVDILSHCSKLSSETAIKSPLWAPKTLLWTTGWESIHSNIRMSENSCLFTQYHSYDPGCHRWKWSWTQARNLTLGHERPNLARPLEKVTSPLEQKVTSVTAEYQSQVQYIQKIFMSIITTCGHMNNFSTRCRLYWYFLKLKSVLGK